MRKGGSFVLWHTLEELQLKTLWNRGDTAPMIAKVLGRSSRAITAYVFKHRERLKLVRHIDTKMKDAQRKFFARQIEQAIQHGMTTTGRRRGAVIGEFIQYLFAEPKRRKAVRIVDLGGMLDGGHVREFGTDRKPRSKAA